jgi:hypothetical protein
MILERSFCREGKQLSRILLRTLTTKSTSMKVFIFLIAALIIFKSPGFSQQKTKTKTDHAKVKVQGQGFAGDNLNLQADTIQAVELVGLSKKWMDAMMKHDSTQLETIMAAEYNLKKGDGSVAAERAMWLYNLYNHLKISRFEQSSISAQVYGNIGIVTSMYSWAGTMHNNQFESKGYMTDVWLKRNNHWQVVSRTSATFPGSNTLEGK